MFEVTASALELAPLIDAVRHDGCGAIVTFIGVVRQLSDDDRAVDGLSYEAYPAMVLAEFRAIAREAVARCGGVRIAIVHRVGSLGIGEASVAIAVSAPHRADAFDACEYAIDELKRRAPIWKKEHYVTGEPRWRDNEASAP